MSKKLQSLTTFTQYKNAELAGSKASLYEGQNVLDISPFKDTPHLFEDLGTKLINDATGEIYLSRDNFFQAIDQVGEPSVFEEVAPPLIQNFEKNRDLKKRAMALVGANSVHQIFNPDIGSDDDDMNDLLSDDANEVEDFNKHMDQSIYAVGDDGMAKYERDNVKNTEELKQLREFMALKDQFSAEDIQRILSEAQNSQVIPQNDGSTSGEVEADD